MSYQRLPTPRIILVRHGQTEWSRTGQFTGCKAASDISLTEEGIEEISSMAEAYVGTGKIIDLAQLRRIIVSPMKRTLQTLQLIIPSTAEIVNKGGLEQPDIIAQLPNGKTEIEITNNVKEWDYGNYDGLTEVAIRKLRKSKGMDRDREWDIWSDGCDAGEAPENIEQRLDQLIVEIKNLQAPYINGGERGDVLIVAHGLILRCLMKRLWNLHINAMIRLSMRPASVLYFSYKNGDIGKPCLELGLPPLLLTHKAC